VESRVSSDPVRMRADGGQLGDEACSGTTALQDRMRLLNAALDKAVRANRPIIISRLPSASSQDSARTAAHLVVDPALLAALQPQVRSAHAQHAPCSCPSGGGRGGGRPLGGVSYERAPNMVDK
jgi:hypothetical protein